MHRITLLIPIGFCFWLSNCTRQGPPDAAIVPTLQVNETAEHRTMVSATFTTIPNFTFDMWMYESSPVFSHSDTSTDARKEWKDRTNYRFINFRTLSDGVLELEHTIVGGENIILKTTITPISGGIDIVVSPILVDTLSQVTEILPVPNLCFQTRNAEVFKSDSANYQEFVKRCFIFTNKGQTFLDRTTRIKNTVFFSEDDPRMNPPMAQLYTASWRKDIPAMSKMFGAGHSPDRFVKPVIGIQARDGKYIVAVATKNSDLMWQAYLDCVHNNPIWEPLDGPIEERRLHTRIVLMKNNIDQTLEDKLKIFEQ